MIAAGSWYTSATTLSVALIVLAALTLAVTVYLWRVGPPRKRIIYAMPSTSLLALHPEDMEGYSDRPVEVQADDC